MSQVDGWINGWVVGWIDGSLLPKCPELKDRLYKRKSQDLNPTFSQTCYKPVQFWEL